MGTVDKLDESCPQQIRYSNFNFRYSNFDFRFLIFDVLHVVMPSRMHDVMKHHIQMILLRFYNWFTHVNLVPEIKLSES